MAKASKKQESQVLYISMVNVRSRDGCDCSVSYDRDDDAFRIVGSETEVIIGDKTGAKGVMEALEILLRDHE